jgi:hypothetical protein
MREDRNRQAEARDDLDSLQDTAPTGSGGIVLQTFTQTTYPTTAGAIYACNPCFVNALDTEGATATITPDTTQVIYALNLGSTVPPTGTTVIGITIGGRTSFCWSG